MESFSFELRLVDSVTASVKKAAKAVEDFGAKARKIQESVDSSWNKISDTLNRNAAKTQASAQSMGKAHSAAIVANGKLEAATKRQTERAVQKQNAVAASISKSHSVALGMNEKLEKAVQSRGDRTTSIAIRNSAKQEASTRRLGLAQMAAGKEDKRRKEAGDAKNSFLGGFGQKLGFRSVADYAKGAFVGGLAASAVTGIAGAFVSGAEKAVSLISQGVKQAFGTAAGEQTQRISERNVLGVDGSKSFRKDADRFAGMTSFDDGEIRKMMLPARKAGIGQDATRQMFATAADLGDGDAGATSTMMESFRKLYTKHGASKKSLVPILEEAGLSVPEFYAALGKKLKISAKEAEKRAESDIDPQLAMNIITGAVNDRQGGIGGTGNKRHADGLEGQYKKLTELPDEFFKKFADSPGMGKATDAIRSLVENLSPDSENGKKIFSALEHQFLMLTGWMKTAFTAENIDKFANGVSSVVSALASIPAILDSVFRISRDVFLVWTSVKLANAISGFAGGVQKGIATGVPSAPGAPGASPKGSDIVGKGMAVLQSATIGYAVGSFLDDVTGFSDAAGTLGRGSDDAADAAFDIKYGGDGRALNLKYLPADQIGASSGRPLTVNGGINVIVGEGADGKKIGEHVNAALRDVQKSQGGGASHPLAPAGHVTERSAGESS